MKLIYHYQALAQFALQGSEGYYRSREYLAGLLIEELEEFTELRGKKALDIGGELGHFAKILATKKKCQAVNLEPQKLNFVWKTVIASANNLPFPNNSFDLVLLRGVIQHIPTDKKDKVLKEAKRVLKNGGLGYIMIPPWFSPLSGQNIKPFQYFPFPVAKHLRNSLFGSHVRANSLAELGLWPMTFRSTRKLIFAHHFEILKTIDILFRWHFLTKIPVIRELLPSVGFIIKK